MLPGVFESDIQIELRSVNLDLRRPPSYHALSYAWGESNTGCAVEVKLGTSDKILPVTQNVHTALRYLRDLSSPRVLRIDAICIHQQDVTERNQQVLNMGNIYRLAEKVIIWLGPECDNSSVAMQAFSTLSSKITGDWGHYKVSPASEKDAGSDWANMDVCAPFTRDIYTSIFKFLDRHWFHRLWIWQEVCLAGNRAEIFCGHEILAWEKFRKAIASLSRRRKPENIPRTLRVVTRAWYITNLSRGLSLRTILNEAQYAQCSDNRDRIYGILHLINEEQRMSIKPDYNKSAPEIYQDFMITCIFDYAYMTLLTYCEIRDNEAANMPSWVPDWSKRRMCREIPFARGCWNAIPQARYKANIGTLIATGCRGLRTTTVKAVLCSKDRGGNLSQSQTALAALRRLVAAIQDELLLDFDQKSEMICRTLFFNEFSDRFEPENHKYPNFRDPMSHFLELSDQSREVFDQTMQDCESMLDIFYHNVLDRSFFITAEGFFGLAPITCRENDRVVVLLGCQSPMVLRPQDGTENHLVVGECYVHGWMDGEAFLGPLSNNWQRVGRYDAATQSNRDAFIDRQRGLCQVEDPRLGALPEGWVEEEHPMQHSYARFRKPSTMSSSITYDPRMFVSSLRARGVELREYNLV